MTCLANATNDSFAASNATSRIDQSLKQNSDDIGWEYTIIVGPGNLDKVQCKLCKKNMSGGVHRVKKHIAHIKGSVTSCPRSTNEDKSRCNAALAEAVKRKNEKKKHQKELREEVQVVDEEEDEVVEVGSKRKKPHFLGPMDRFASTINPDSSIDAMKRMKQQNMHDALWKDRTQSVHQYLARWVYEAGIPFYAIDNDSFQRFVEAVGQFGPGYQPPSQYELREPLLKKEVERTKNSLKKQEEEWAVNGCSIMTDAWTDRKRRSIMNLCVNCQEGTTFLSSKEASNDVHTGEYIFEYVDKWVEEIGTEKVVQVVTNNASNNMATANLLKLKRPNIFWTSCATHIEPHACGN